MGMLESMMVGEDGAGGAGDGLRQRRETGIEVLIEIEGVECVGARHLHFFMSYCTLAEKECWFTERVLLCFQ